MIVMASDDWLIHFRLLPVQSLKRLDKTIQEVSTQCPLTILCVCVFVFDRSKNKDHNPGRSVQMVKVL